MTILDGLGAARARILETVWYVGWHGSYEDLFEHINSIMSANDSLLVVEGKEAIWRNLLVADDALVEAWNENRR